MIFRRPKRILAVSEVYGEPGWIAVLYAGDLRYTYIPPA